LKIPHGLPLSHTKLSCGKNLRRIHKSFLKGQGMATIGCQNKNKIVKRSNFLFTDDFHRIHMALPFFFTKEPTIDAVGCGSNLIIDEQSR